MRLLERILLLRLNEKENNMERIAKYQKLLSEKDYEQLCKDVDSIYHQTEELGFQRGNDYRMDALADAEQAGFEDGRDEGKKWIFQNLDHKSFDAFFSNLDLFELEKFNHYYQNYIKLKGL